MTDKHPDTAAFLALVNDQTEYRHLMQRLPLQEFISMQCWPSLRQQLRQQLFLWLFRMPLITLDLAVKYDVSVALSMGYLHHLLSGPFAIGYLIEIPSNCRTEMTPSYLSSIHGKSAGPLQSIDDLPNLDHLLNGLHLSIFAMENTQTIAAIRKDMADFLH